MKLLLIMSMILCATGAMASDVGLYGLNQISYGKVGIAGRTSSGNDADMQTRYNMGMALELFEQGQVLSFASVGMRYAIEGTGYMQEPSAPFSIDHGFTPYLKREQFPWLSYEVSWMHQSNGMAGKDSRSWDRAGASALVDWWGIFMGKETVVQGNFTAWALMDEGTNTEFVGPLRGFGDGNWGIEGSARVLWGDHILLLGDVREGFYLGGAGWNPTGGDNSYYFTLSYLKADGVNLFESGSPQDMLMAGITLGPSE